MDCSLSGSSVRVDSPGRNMEWVASASPGDLPNPGIKPGSPALQADSFFFFAGVSQGKQCCNLFVLVEACVCEMSSAHHSLASSPGHGVNAALGWFSLQLPAGSLRGFQFEETPYVKFCT